MESSIQEILKPEIAIGAVLVIGIIVSMRFMPRLMAGVPFVEPKAGFSNVAIIKGGMISSSKQDLPVEK